MKIGTFKMKAFFMRRYCILFIFCQENCQYIIQILGYQLQARIVDLLPMNSKTGNSVL